MFENTIVVAAACSQDALLFTPPWCRYGFKCVIAGQDRNFG
jgi:hypothetical protein